MRARRAFGPLYSSNSHAAGRRARYSGSMELDDETFEMLLLLLLSDGEERTADELIAAVERWMARRDDSDGLP